MEERPLFNVDFNELMEFDVVLLSQTDIKKGARGRDVQNCRVGKGAFAPCPPFLLFDISIAVGTRSPSLFKLRRTSRFAHPTNFVFARSVRNEAIQWNLDCLASLAMTMGSYAALKPATAFASRYSSSPNRPHSRPLPDCL